MAEVVLEVVSDALSKILIEEYALLGGAARQVEWIEKELRSVQGLLEQVEQSTYDQNAQELNDLAEKLKETALDAKNVIETFMLKSVKWRRWGVLYVADKHDVGVELLQIGNRMRNISQKIMNYLNTDNVSVSVETPGEAITSSSTTTVVAPAMEKLDHILSQNLITGNKAIKMVEQVRDGLKDLQNIVSKLSSSSERESVWLEEVKAVSNYTAGVAENFIAKREKWLKMSVCGLSRKNLVLCEGNSSENEFKKEMKYVRAQIGDALHRSLTYEVQGKDTGVGLGFKQCSTPVPDIPLEMLIVVEILLIVYCVGQYLPIIGKAPLMFSIVLALLLLLLLLLRGLVYYPGKRGRTTRRRKSSQKMKKKLKGEGKKLLQGIMLFTFSYAVKVTQPMLMSLLMDATFTLVYLPSEIFAWTVDLLRSLTKNLECMQRDINLMLVFLSDTKSSVEGSLNERQRVWLGQLKDMAQNGQSLVHLCPTAKGKGLAAILSRIKFAKDINNLLKQIIDISNRKTIYGIANIFQQGTMRELVSSGPSMEKEEIQIGGTGAEEHPVTPEASGSFFQPALKDKVKSLRGEMELLDALSLDVQDMGDLDTRFRIWVDQMECIGREIKSIIVEYDTKLEHKPILIYIFKCWTRRIISNKIHEIRKKIEDASRRRRTYGLVQFQTHTESLSSTVQILRGTTQLSLVAAESSVVGFDDDVHVLMTQLLSDEKRRCITWIVGIGGTGKTTLAKLAFEDKAVVDHFECQVWVSSTSEARQLLQEIANEATKQITPDSSFTCNNHDILQTLSHTKYLIVVDGIEEINSQVCLWDTLKEAIPDKSTGSRLLFTTCNANLARHAADTITFVHPLQLLDDESSWILFTRNLKVDNVPQEELMTVGREIVMKCGGLPSQILKMSKLLSQKDVTYEEWSSVLNQDQVQIWSETLKTINEDLPLYLRGCLSYFGLFPAEFGVPVRRLVVLWVAEERVHHGEDHEPPEQVAERYLTKLIDKNLVQVAKRKRNGKVKTCRLPYALRQLWWTKANGSIFLKSRSPSTDSNANPKTSIIRWLTDHLNTDHIWYNHIHGHGTRNSSTSLRTYYRDVRSLLSFDTREGSKPGQEIGHFMKESISSHCFLLLRVLDLESVYKPKLPKSIARLSQLRYLGLRWTYLESLPSFISELLKLQTLDLKHTYIHTLPHSIWEMELRHLFLSETFHSRFPPQQKDHLSHIRFLLPHLRDDFLSDLQTLWGLFVDEETPVKNSLDRLVSITKLGLACQQMSLQEDAMTDQLEAVADWIAKLENLQSLRLKSRDEQGTPWMLHLKSFQNNINLTDIYLLGILSSSSILSQFPLSLIELTLSHSKLKEDPMQILEAFPNLRTLCLHAESYIGKSLLCKSRSFPQLHVLKIWKLEQLEEWIIEPGALPCLRQLEIRMCPRLQMLPDGLKHVNTLLELKLTNMPMEINANAHNIPPNCQVI